ncbi:MAG: hypothetical protein KBB54_04260 [Candidatus Pacebacteria bacterium]|nr:hypothetical protein [Candidatus Paceibacterota bacterium]MBP9818738.1 hypothetical protein [Candidatus Paceibacterota bacterium]
MRLSSSLVFYIGNGVVKAAVVVHEKSKLPRIISTRVRDLPHFEERDRDHLEKRILFEFGEMVREFKSEDVKKLATTNNINGASYNLKFDNAFVLVSSPWYISETSIIKMREQKPFLVTDALIGNSQQQIIKAYSDAHKLDVTVLEQKIINILLNGYPTNDPIKKRAETLDMTVFTSFARKSSIDRIRDVIDTNFHVHDISIHSQSLVSFSVISDTWHDETQYIIADVTSQLTELVAIRKGALSEAYSFPKGKQFLMRAIAEKLKVASEVAESLIRMKNEGTIEPELNTKLDLALESAKKEWLKSFSDSLAVMSASSSLPSKFFLFAPKDVVHIFSEYITCEEYQQFSFAEGKFQVQHIGVSDLLPYCKIENGATGDLSLMIGAIFNTKMKSII